MKGIELPINVLIIVVIAVIVLLGIIAVYFAGWTPYASSSGVDAVKNDACRILVMGHGCDIEPDQIEITNFDGADDLQELCDVYFGTGGDIDACKAICGCGGVVSILGGGGGGGGGTCVCDWVPWSPSVSCFIISLGINGYMSTCECNNPGCGGTCINAVGNTVSEGAAACIPP
jgi:hypothetical protein